MYGPDCMGQILDIKHGYYPKIVTSVSRPGKDRQTAKKEIKDTPGISWLLIWCVCPVGRSAAESEQKNKYNGRPRERSQTNCLVKYLAIPGVSIWFSQYWMHKLKLLTLLRNPIVYFKNVVGFQTIFLGVKLRHVENCAELRKNPVELRLSSSRWSRLYIYIYIPWKSLKFILPKYFGRLCRYYFVWSFFENHAFHKRTHMNLKKTRRYARKIGDTSGLQLVLP